MLYATGHGGDGFLKLSDAEEVAAPALAAAVASGLRSGAWAAATALLDTCQAASLVRTWRSPGALALASSAVGENSLSWGVDADGAGGSLGDGFTTQLAAHLLSRAKSPPATPVAAPCLTPPASSPTTLIAGPLSLNRAIAMAQQAACSPAAAPAPRAPAAAGSEPTLADLVAAIPSQLIGSTVVAHGSGSAPLAFYAGLLRQQAVGTDGAAGADADVIAAALLAGGTAEPAACVTVRGKAHRQSAADLAAYIRHAQRCGAGTRGRLRAADSEVRWWEEAPPAAGDVSHCRDILALLASCLGHRLAATLGALPLERALLRSRSLAQALGGGG